jgi:hypothetical protein
MRSVPSWPNNEKLQSAQQTALACNLLSDPKHQAPAPVDEDLKKQLLVSAGSARMAAGPPLPADVPSRLLWWTVGATTGVLAASLLYSLTKQTYELYVPPKVRPQLLRLVGLALQQLGLGYFEQGLIYLRFVFRSINIDLAPSAGGSPRCYQSTAPGAEVSAWVACGSRSTFVGCLAQSAAAQLVVHIGCHGPRATFGRVGCTLQQHGVGCCRTTPCQSLLGWLL